MGHLKRECPQTICFNCGHKGHEQGQCSQARRERTQAPRGVGGYAQAFVIDNVHEERKQMMGRLEEVERRVAQGGQAPLVPSKGDTSGDVKEDSRGGVVPDRARKPGLEGLLDGIATEIRREIVKTNKNFHINPLHPERRHEGRK